MTDLIDTTEMYLRTVFELEEEGITPMRARISERLAHSGPTVSETVARMERDGLIEISPDRILNLTPEGRKAAESVMRKHRLAECLLVDVIKLPLALVHQEACRWEHVISEEVEVRIYEMLNHPELSPFGNPIPGLAELLNRNIGEKFRNSGEDAINNLATVTGTKVLITRLGESIQSEVDIFNELLAARIIPGAIIDLQKTSEGILLKADSEVGLTIEEASHIFGSPLS